MRGLHIAWDKKRVGALIDVSRSAEIYYLFIRFLHMLFLSTLKGNSLFMDADAQDTLTDRAGILSVAAEPPVVNDLVGIASPCIRFRGV